MKVSLWTKTIGFRQGVREGVALVFLSLRVTSASVALGGNLGFCTWWRSLRVTFAVKVSLSVEILVFELGSAHCVLRLL